MRRTLLVAILALGLVPLGCGKALKGELAGNLPADGAVAGLERTTPPRQIFRDNDIESYFGKNANFIRGMGLNTLHVAEYTLGGPGRSLMIEAYQMNSEHAPAGMYYHYRAHRLHFQGEKVDVGAEGLLDTRSGGRNLYFYKGHWFFSLVYTGKEPIPDLVPLAQRIAAGVQGQNVRPRGFLHLEVDGVDAENAFISPGNMLNCEWLPPGVQALAPGAGPKAVAFVIPFADEKIADNTRNEFRQVLHMEGRDVRRARLPGDLNLTAEMGEDPKLGRVTFVTYRNWLVGVVHAEDYEPAQAILHRICLDIRNRR